MDWAFASNVKKNTLNHYSLDSGVYIFCGNYVECCSTNCFSHTEEYELSVYECPKLNHDSVPLARLPYKVTADAMVTPLRELAHLPKGIRQLRNLPPQAQRPGLCPEKILEQIGNTDAD